ncbi:MAG: transposase, partial [Flammeovirgaceae bacterium]
NGFVKGKFQWQEGYGAFSYGNSQIVRVYNYIMNQKRHHAKTYFVEEYKQLLEKFEVAFDERFILKSAE